MLKNCPECNHQVSETAEKCPHCGAPRPPSRDVNAITWFYFFLVGLGLYYFYKQVNGG